MAKQKRNPAAHELIKQMMAMYQPEQRQKCIFGSMKRFSIICTLQIKDRH